MGQRRLAHRTNEQVGVVIMACNPLQLVKIVSDKPTADLILENTIYISTEQCTITQIIFRNYPR